MIPLRVTCIPSMVVAVLALTVAPGVAMAAQDPGFPASVDNADVLPEGARLERLFEATCFTEGPTAAPDGTIYFSDITHTMICHDEDGLTSSGHIWRYDPATSEATVFRSPSNMSNGLEFDAQGNLIAAEVADTGGRRVTRTDLETGKAVVLAYRYDGRRLNSPNDLAIDEQGRIYFSDPRYSGAETVEQPVMAVYRIDPNGSITRLITDAGKPNGLLVSPDQETLYVVSNDNGALDGRRLKQGETTYRGPMVLWAYELKPDGTVGARRIFTDYAPQTGADGLTADEEGNLYVAARRADAPGIYVYSPEGEEIAFISTGEELPTNAGFGRGQGANMLYVTAGKSLYRIETNKRGYHLPAAN